MLRLPAAGFAAALLVQPTVADVISEPPPWEYAEPYWAASDAAARIDSAALRRELRSFLRSVYHGK